MEQKKFPAHLTLEKFGLYKLSLTEDEGTSFLITRKIWTKQVLPIFQLPAQEPLLTVKGKGSPGTRRRHKFIVVPVQEAYTRLARLNTRRWKQQNIKCSGLSIKEYLETGGKCGYPPLLRFCPNSTSPFRSGTSLLVSYPRSGNTLLRSLLESITGIVTGSDTRPDRTLSLALADRHDLVGEGVISTSQTSIVKTHWPERIGYRPYTAHRAVLLVRNPFDAIDSYWNLNVTNTHTDKVVDEVYQEHAVFFQQLALNEMKIWLDFLHFWNSQREHAPILWMRYEDLIQNPLREMLRALDFLTKKDSDNWRGRVDEVLQRKGHGYQSIPLGATSKSTEKALPFGQSLTQYPPELLHQMHEIDKFGWLEKMGYHVYNQGFPQNIANGDFPPLPVTFEEDKGNNSAPNPASILLRINQPSNLELRPSHCPYGRNMRNWRRTHTNDDTTPFPTRSIRL